MKLPWLSLREKLLSGRALYARRRRSACLGGTFV